MRSRVCLQYFSVSRFLSLYPISLSFWMWVYVFESVCVRAWVYTCGCLNNTIHLLRFAYIIVRLVSPKSRHPSINHYSKVKKS